MEILLSLLTRPDGEKARVDRSELLEEIGVGRALGADASPLVRSAIAPSIVNQLDVCAGVKS